jgi:hypothetical protein
MENKITLYYWMYVVLFIKLKMVPHMLFYRSAYCTISTILFAAIKVL